MSLLHVATPRFEGHKFSREAGHGLGLAAVLTLLVSPVLLGVGLAVALTSQGRLFYLSERVGRDGRIFRMVKFRTMRVGADRDVTALPPPTRRPARCSRCAPTRGSPASAASCAGTRSTSCRSSSTCSCGHMSLVGPRPPLPHEVAAYEERMRRRLLVKPGMTGMWQVSGRSDLPWEESVRLDVYYAENWTPFLDLLILAQTARAVVSGRGAY